MPPDKEQVRRLRLAVKEVIAENKAAGYIPSRFIGMTEEGEAADIVQVCERLLTSADAFAEVERATKKYPKLDCLEDKVVTDPEGFGFSAEAAEQAHARVQYLNSIVPGRRRR